MGEYISKIFNNSILKPYNILTSYTNTLISISHDNGSNNITFIKDL
jgi:hypothetical protein